MKIRRKDLARIIQEELRRVLREEEEKTTSLTSPPKDDQRLKAWITTRVERSAAKRVGKSPSGTVIVSFSTDKDGKVTGDVTHKDTTGDDALGNCIAGKVKKLIAGKTFKANGKGSWTFKPR